MCGRWLTLTEEQTLDYAPIPQTAGCYAVYLDGRLSYIGQADNMRRRIRSHLSLSSFSTWIKTKWGYFRAAYVKVRPSRKYGEEKMVEARLLRRTRPRFNTHIPQPGCARG